MSGAGKATAPPLLLVAHGTRETAGVREVDRIAAGAADRMGDAAVRVAYVDVTGPTVADALADIDGPVIALPAFLASGYHVRTDLPAQVKAAGRSADVTITPALGPAPEIAEVMLQRLIAAGWKRGDRVLFSAAGSSDERALADAERGANRLGTRCDQRLRPSYVTRPPRTADVCAAFGDTVIAPYLLAPGQFHDTLARLPVQAVADPIGAHPLVIDLLVRRYHEALRRGLCPWRGSTTRT